MLKSIIPSWLDEVHRRVDLSPSTKVTYTRIAARLQAWTGDHDSASLDLTSYVVNRLEAGAAPRTVALELRVAAAAMRWAQRTLRLPLTLELRRPRLRIDPRQFVLNHRTPTPRQAAAALAAMPLDDWRLATLLLARTGARIGEVVRLRSSDLDEETGRLSLGAVVGASKSGLRCFPLDRGSVELLAGRSGRGHAPLFDFGSVTAPIQALERRLRRACELAAIPAFTPHGLRRMVVGRLLRARVDPGTAASLTGHTVEVMLKYYQQVTDEDRRAAVEQAQLGVFDG